MKMIIVQELVPHPDLKVLELFAENGPLPGTEELWVSVDGRHVFAMGDFADLSEWNRLSELYQPAYAGPARFFPVVSPEVSVGNARAGIEARS